MATVFERLEILVKELASKIDNLSNDIAAVANMLNDVKSETNSMFLNFSDVIGERFEEISDKVKGSSGAVISGGEGSKIVEDLRILIESYFKKIPAEKASKDTSDLSSEVSELKDSVEMLKDAMNYVTSTLGDVSKKIELIPNIIERTMPISQTEQKVKVLQDQKPLIPESDSTQGGFEQVIYKGALRPPTQRAQKTKVEPAIRPDIARIYAGELKTGVTTTGIKKAVATAVAETTKTIKIESTPRSTTGTVPDKVFQLLEGIKGKLGMNVQALAREMENTRDEIVKIYKFHPTLYELGTFARKLKKYPENLTLDEDLRNLLFDKINEWKKRLAF